MCEAAENGIDLTDDSVSERLLRVYVDAIGDWGVSASGWVAPAGTHDEALVPEARALVRSLQRDGARIDDHGELATTTTALERPNALAPELDRRAVMVVHGRNELARRGMFNFLRAMSLRPLEWGTLVAGTKTATPYVGEVLEHAFRTAAAVVVLFTPDDEARLRASLRSASDPSYEIELTPQARPNVLFEAGMALGLHPNRTILVELGRLRPFSDIYGRHVVRLDGTEPPLRDIARRLHEAGCDIDTSGEDWADPAQFPDAEPSGADDFLRSEIAEGQRLLTDAASLEPIGKMGVLDDLQRREGAWVDRVSDALANHEPEMHERWTNDPRWRIGRPTPVTRDQIDRHVVAWIRERLELISEFQRTRHERRTSPW